MPKQLISHILVVTFISPSKTSTEERFDVADALASKLLGRKIARWLIQGEGYSVTSYSKRIIWK